MLKQPRPRDAVAADDRVHLHAVGRLEVVLDERVAHLVVAPQARRLLRLRQLVARPVERWALEALRERAGDEREHRLFGLGDGWKPRRKVARVHLVGVDRLEGRGALVGEQHRRVVVRHHECVQEDGQQESDRLLPRRRRRRASGARK
eukprot:1931779-Prymnesium_polylepis.1